MAEIPHFAFPFTRGNKGVVVVEQDSHEHIMSCVLTVVHCPVGFRVERPEFGIPYLDYRSQIDPSGSIEAAVRSFEPRSNVTSTQIRDWLSEGESIITLEIEVN